MTGFQRITRERPPEEFTATVTLKTLRTADIGPVLDAIEAVVAVSPLVTGKVDGGEQYTRTFYGWDRDVWRKP
jgi:hypothetical protein